MSYTGQNPASDGQLTSGDSGGSRSCVAYSFAYACDDATNGKFKPTGRTVRQWTGDTNGGLELSQCEVAVERHSNLVEFATVTLTRAQFYGRLAEGYGAVLLGGYSPIAHSRFSGQNAFIGNHGIYVPPGFAVMDPLADGRRPGVYKYHGEPYPTSLIDDFAAHLRLSNGQSAGSNHYEVSLVKIAPAAHATAYRVVLSPGIIGKYRVAGRAVVGSPRRYMLASPGYTSNCTVPKSYLRPGHPAAHLVRVTKGRLAGDYISIKNANVKLETR